MPSGSCFVPVPIAALQASLGSELFSLRQVVISSALGMNALQSLSTSGVHAKRCSGVPCEKERAGDVVVGSKASDTHNCAKGVSQSSMRWCWLSVFMRGFMADFDTLLPEHALVARRQSL